MKSIRQMLHDMDVNKKNRREGQKKFTSQIKQPKSFTPLDVSVNLQKNTMISINPQTKFDFVHKKSRSIRLEHLDSFQTLNDSKHTTIYPKFETVNSDQPRQNGISQIGKSRVRKNFHQGNNIDQNLSQLGIRRKILSKRQQNYKQPTIRKIGYNTIYQSSPQGKFLLKSNRHYSPKKFTSLGNKGFNIKGSTRMKIRSPKKRKRSRRQSSIEPWDTFAYEE